VSYTDEFLAALGAWQRGWKEQPDRRGEITTKLVSAIESAPPLPEVARTVRGKCYRKRFLVANNPQNDGDLYRLVMMGSLQEGIASWTIDLRYAQDFKGPVRDGAISAVFGHQPKPDEVVLNIQALWTLRCFREAVGDFASRGGSNADALQNFKARQSEVILNATLLREDVEGFCERSSPFELLCEVAGITDEAEKDKFWEQMVVQGIFPGEAHWLQKEAAQHVLQLCCGRFDQGVKALLARSAD
jgi:hypothetical protein